MSTIEFNTYITDAEWEVMRVVWANDRVTSKKVISVLQEKMDWTQSTIKTILGRLVGKGVLNTEHEGRKFIAIVLKDNANVIYIIIKHKEDLK